jgi:hypothetical protein
LILRCRIVDRPGEKVRLKKRIRESDLGDAEQKKMVQRLSLELFRADEELRRLRSDGVERSYSGRIYFQKDPGTTNTRIVDIGVKNGRTRDLVHIEAMR